MNYDELADFAASMPRIPRREMRCHPLVVMALREESQWLTAKHTPLWNIYDLIACPVLEDPTMEPGAWEIYEDDVVVRSGNLDS